MFYGEKWKLRDEDVDIRLFYFAQKSVKWWKQRRKRKKVGQGSVTIWHI